MPKVGTRDVCARCGRVIWLKPMGTMGYTSAEHAGETVYEWSARKGSKPKPLQCPVSDGWPFTHHQPANRAVRYYAETP